MILSQVEPKREGLGSWLTDTLGLPSIDFLAPVQQAVQGVGSGIANVFKPSGSTQPAGTAQGIPSPQDSSEASLIAGVSNTTLILVGVGVTVGLIALMAGGGRRDAHR